MDLFEELSWRGLINQMTHPDLPQKMAEQPLTFYCGFDPTADSLHIGSLLPIMAIAHLQRAGHRPLVLVGGATGMIGDPSFKKDERSLLTKAQVDFNAEGIRRQLERFLDFGGANAAVMVNNADWLGTLPLIDFLRDIGKHFSVNAMLNKESVRMRIEDRDQGISFTEFSYSLLQAYDFLHLCREYDCRLQIGGSDQWGNIVAGMDLSRRLLAKETFGLTIPLVTKSDGTKFGKSESGNVWLDANRTSPYRFYQFWINQSDADTPQYLKFFTFIPREEIEALERCITEEPHKRAAQQRLAAEVTRMVHGEEAFQNALKASQAMFGGDLRGLDEAALLEVFSEVPSVELPRTILDSERLLVDVLVENGIFESKGEVKRMIKNGGLYVSGARIESEDAKLSEQSCLTETVAVVRKGKKNYYLLRFQG